jgi:hypothetical protein
MPTTLRLKVVLSVATLVAAVFVTVSSGRVTASAVIADWQSPKAYTAVVLLSEF